MIKKAFSLIEVLVTSIIMAIVLIGAGSFMIANTRLSQKVILEINTMNMYNSVLRSLKNDVRNSVSIDISNVGTNTGTIVTMKNKNNDKIIWKNSFTEISGDTIYSLYRNGKKINIPGVEKYSVDTKFISDTTFVEQNINSLSTLVLDIKFEVWSKNKQFQINSGNGYSRYFLFCRNKGVLKD